jgi:hypothetical protein
MWGGDIDQIFSFQIFKKCEVYRSVKGLMRFCSNNLIAFGSNDDQCHPILSEYFSNM